MLQHSMFRHIFAFELFKSLKLYTKMKKISTLILAVFSIISLNAQTTTWNFDKAHSSIGFAVSHMVISETEGKFNAYEGTVSSENDDFTGAKINFTIDVNSIDTENEKRDGHLKSADFFDTEKHPSITFVSKSLTKVKGNKYSMTGDLMMMGVTKEITLDVKYNGTIKDPWGNTKAGFKITGTIERALWNLKYNSVMDNGGLMIGEDIDLTCNVELILEK